MSIRNGQRILRKIHSEYPGQKKLTIKEFRLCVDVVGTTDKCYYHYRDVMIRRGLIKTKGNKWIILTQKGIIGLISEDDEEIEEIEEETNKIRSIPERPKLSEIKDIDEEFKEEVSPVPLPEEKIIYDKDGYNQFGEHILSEEGKNRERKSNLLS